MDKIEVYLLNDSNPIVFTDDKVNVEYQLGTIYNQFFEQISIRKTHEIANTESSSLTLTLKNFAATINNAPIHSVNWYKNNTLVNTLQITPIELSYNIVSLPENNGVEEYLAFNKGKSEINAAMQENTNINEE